MKISKNLVKIKSTAKLKTADLRKCQRKIKKKKNIPKERITTFFKPLQTNNSVGIEQQFKTINFVRDQSEKLLETRTGCHDSLVRRERCHWPGGGKGAELEQIGEGDTETVGGPKNEERRLTNGNKGIMGKLENSQD